MSFLRRFKSSPSEQKSSQDKQLSSKQQHQYRSRSSSEHRHQRHHHSSSITGREPEYGEASNASKMTEQQLLDLKYQAEQAISQRQKRIEELEEALLEARQRTSTPQPSTSQPSFQEQQVDRQPEPRTSSVNIIEANPKIILNSTNFVIWKSFTEDLFKLKGLEQHISDEEAASKDTRNELKAKLCLASTLDEKMLLKIQGCKSTYEMMQRIIILHENFTRATVGRLLMKFYSEQRKKSESMGEYLSRIEHMRNELAALGQPQTDEAFICKILSNLPRGYETFKQIWDVSNPEMKSVPNLIMRIMEREEDIKKSHENEKGEALATRLSIEERKKRTKCAKCGQKGHWAKECSTKSEEYLKRSAAKSAELKEKLKKLAL